MSSVTRHVKLICALKPHSWDCCIKKKKESDEVALASAEAKVKKWSVDVLEKLQRQSKKTTEDKTTEFIGKIRPGGRMLFQII